MNYHAFEPTIALLQILDTSQGLSPNLFDELGVQDAQL